jgi:PiT family inorganic phosphate transporter
MTIIFTVIVVALAFEYINGFHDTANSIATVVSTKVLTPRQAVLLAASTNLLGALWGTAVAQTIASGLVDAQLFTLTNSVLICALLGAIIWNLITWYFGIPSSSSHALIGGLCGAALAASQNNWNVIIWAQPAEDHWYHGKGLLWKVLVPMVTSPICGLILGFTVMTVLYLALHRLRPQLINQIFGKLQMLSAAGMGFMHGTNDAQKTMGIVALALFAATQAGTFNDLPPWLSFLKIPEPPKGRPLEIAVWIKVMCAITMASGTAAGGWRIIRTLGHRMVKLHPINGFAAETSSATVIFAATHLGIPVSTTHNISAAIMGVGAAKRLNAVSWVVVERMVWAWVLTLPISGGLAYLASLLHPALAPRASKRVLKLEIIRRHPVLIAAQHRDASGQTEPRLSGVAGVKIESLANRLAPALVRVPKDHDVRVLADNAAFDLLLRRIHVQNVMQQELPPAQFEHFGVFVFQALVRIAGDGGDRSDFLQFEDEPGQADVARVQDMVHTFEEARDFGVEVTVRVGENADSCHAALESSLS